MASRMPRREFVKRGAAGAAGLASGPALAGLFGGQDPELRNPRVPFELGLASYTCREFGLDDMIAMARRVGLLRVSLKDVHLPLTATDAEIAAAVARIRAAGLTAYGCGVVYMKTPAEVERAFAYAGIAGMEIIIGVPDPALLPLVERKVRETGIRLAIHNHGPEDPVYPTPRLVYDRIKDLAPGVGLCLDIGHCRRAGIDPAEAAQVCAPRLLDVHLKDVTAPTKEGTYLEIGRGVIDIPRVLRTLARLGFRGTASFEYEKDGKDPLPGLAESVGYVRGVLATL
jgi:inosose dehydratase